MTGDEYFLFSDFSDFSNIFEITEKAEARICETAVNPSIFTNDWIRQKFIYLISNLYKYLREIQIQDRIG